MLKDLCCGIEVEALCGSLLRSCKGGVPVGGGRCCKAAYGAAVEGRSQEVRESILFHSPSFQY